MKTSLKGRQFIAKEEGNILYAYDDATEKRVNVNDSVRGTITIGVGHTSAAGLPKVIPGMVITAAQSDSILASDLGKVEAQINNLVKVPLNQNQFDALVSFQFNTGGLAKSQVLIKLNNKDYKSAADAMLNWSKANGNQTLLLGRRQRERSMFLSPVTSAPVAGTTGAVVIGGGAVVATAPHHYWPWIVGTVVVVLVGIAVYEYIKRKKSNV